MQLDPSSLLHKNVRSAKDRLTDMLHQRCCDQRPILVKIIAFRFSFGIILTVTSAASYLQWWTVCVSDIRISFDCWWCLFPDILKKSIFACQWWDKGSNWVVLGSSSLLSGSVNLHCATLVGEEWEVTAIANHPRRRQRPRWGSYCHWFVSILVCC